MTVSCEKVWILSQRILGCFDADGTATERFVYANNNFHKKLYHQPIKAVFQISNRPRENRR